MLSSTLKIKAATELATDVLNIQWNEKENSDITLICSSMRFSAHKAILAARSPVFAAMFRHSDTEEAATNEVRINDTDSSTLERFLWYV